MDEPTPDQLPWRPSRRDFLRGATGASAGLVLGSLACSPSTGGGSSGSRAGTTPVSSAASRSGAAAAPVAAVEKPQLAIGFIPITCATPIIMAHPLGFYSKYGLDVT